MKKILRFKSRKLFIKLISSLLIFLLVPVIVFLIIFHYNMINYYEKEISNSNLSKLMVTQNTIDGIFNGLTRDALRITEDPSLDYIRYVNISNILKDGNDLVRVDRIIKVLGNVKDLNPCIHSIYLYNRDQKLVVTTGGAGIYKESEFADNEWIHKLNKEGIETVLSGSRIPKENVINKTASIASMSPTVVTLVFPINEYTATFTGAIAININENFLYKYMDSEKGNEQGLDFIADKSGHLFSYKGKSIKGIEDNDLSIISKSLVSKDQNGYFQMIIKGKKYLVTFSKSNLTGLIYIEISSINNLFKKAIIFKILIAAVSLIILVLGVVLSYIISNRIYSPIRNIIENLKEEKVIGEGVDINELLQISNSINYIINERKQLNINIEKSNKDLKQLSILRLIEGKVDEENNEVNYPHSYFMCLILSIDRYIEFERLYEYDEQYTLKLLIIKAYEEMIGVRSPNHGVILHKDKLVIIINSTKENTLNSQEFISKVYSKINNELMKNHGISLSIATGRYYKLKENIKYSYGEACEAIKFKLIYGEKSFIDISMIESRLNKEFYYPVTRERCIMNYMGSNKFEKLKSELEALIDELKINQELSYDNITQILYQLVGNTLKLLISSNDRISDVFGTHCNIYNELIEKETLDDIRDVLTHFYQKIIHYRENDDKIFKNHVKDVIMFIENNYTKNDIDINTISSATGLSYPHLRKVFKDSIGINVTDYITGLRIRKSKELLVETSGTIKEIAEKVGYNNDQSFSRSFKKLEGITPGEFRNSFLRNK